MKIFLAAIALAAVLSPSPMPAGADSSHAGAPIASGTPVLEVLFPPTNSRQRACEDVQKYLLDKSSPGFPLISGAGSHVVWSDLDHRDAKLGEPTNDGCKVLDRDQRQWLGARDS